MICRWWQMFTATCSTAAPRLPPIERTIGGIKRCAMSQRWTQNMEHFLMGSRTQSSFIHCASSNGPIQLLDRCHVANFSRSTATRNDAKSSSQQNPRLGSTSCFLSCYAASFPVIMATGMCRRQTPEWPAEGDTQRNPSLNLGRETKQLKFKGTEHEWLVKETGGIRTH